ncbi:DUF3916 domain-containing protein [Bacillus sp. Xin]|uniref:DUF3916 domain-containing protein n=1 Tax=unclassified Bacillus (in: firmicutes) TaxID=185979 RepID=UPI0015728E16|nr:MULTISPECIES: DUF3916 domain-containing protein [unclassified Bacillus (in: firmicutes)]MBC6973762.1 DUF3916 domain-containing protein [Bacillus sp. Xin]NSW35985.1 DUF3916 domain-containing protein [Bacillus sp. Xin1]
MKKSVWNRRSKRKIRGLRRVCRNFLKYTTTHTSSLPSTTELSSLGCWSIHLPFPPSHLKSKSVKQFYLQTIINRVEFFIHLKTTAEKEYRIYFCVSFPSLQTSNILIVCSKQDIERFFEGFLGSPMDEPQWISLSQERDIKKELGLHIPKELQVKGYTEIFTDPHYNDKEMWFIGELE